MIELEQYSKYFTKIALDRDAQGVLTIRLHTDNGPFVYDAVGHEELASVFRFVADDYENRVVIFTGTGNTFWSILNPPSFAHLQQTPDGWDRTLAEERRTTEGFLAIDVPIISAVNGPSLVHSHLAVMADIVLASENAVFADALHVPAGIVPGDGAHMVWPLLLGINRGRHFLLTGQRLSAADAHHLGVVAEVLPQAELMDRAREVAADLAAKPTLMLRQTRSVLRNQLDSLVVREFSRGMAHESLAALGSLSEHLKGKKMQPLPESAHFLVDADSMGSNPFDSESTDASS
jgi:enoyl-CoA hydratase/carnithine racemase